MPLQTQPWQGVAGQAFVPAAPALNHLPGGANAQISNAIGQLQLGDLFGAVGPTSVIDVFGWRIDRQNAPAGFVNLSVQRNGVGAPSTVATVFVPAGLNVAVGPPRNPMRRE